MTTDFLVLAGRKVGPITDRLRRYCGLNWSGGERETWAYPYYDALQDHVPDKISPVDVLAAAALHPGLSRADLGWYCENAGRIGGWLAKTPDVALAQADKATIGQLDGLVGLAAGSSLCLLTKVLHRKRPNLVPIAERGLIDWYRPVTGERSAVAAWPALFRRLAGDLSDAHNASVLTEILRDLNLELPVAISTVRAADICLWMGGE